MKDTRDQEKGFFWQCIQPHLRVLALVSALMALSSLAALALPWLGGRLAAGLLSLDEVDDKVLLLAVLGLFATRAALSFVSNYLLNQRSERVLCDVRARFYAHLQYLPMSFHTRQRRGDTLSLLMSDIEIVSNFWSTTLLNLFPLLLMAVGSLVLMFRIDPSLTALAAICMPLYFLVLRVIGRRLRPLAREYQDAYADAFCLAEENLEVIAAIKSFTREELEAARYRERAERLYALSNRRGRIQATLTPSVQLVAAMGLVAVVFFAGKRLHDPAEMLTFLLYMGLLTRPVGMLAEVYGKTQSARGAYARLTGVLAEVREDVEEGNVLVEGEERLRGEVEFEDVSFSYPGRPPALSHVSFRLPAGTTLAIQGPNGAGKSTLCELLVGFYQPDTGSIRIDGRDIQELNRQSLRRHIGIVPQHAMLLSCSIRDNIAFGLPEAVEDDILRAAKAARAHDFIQALPDGYDTQIGDRGVRLSGGQQQRISLARALLKDPPILILDEATAMFDTEGEQEFVDSCKQALRGRTILLISHRGSTLSLADQHIQLREGRLV